MGHYDDCHPEDFIWPKGYFEGKYNITKEETEDSTVHHPIITAKTDKELKKLLKEQKTSLQKQEGGVHYKGLKIQPVEYITANNMEYCEANVIKYISRHHLKGGVEDIKKAIHYCELILELKYNDKKV